MASCCLEKGKKDYWFNFIYLSRKARDSGSAWTRRMWFPRPAQGLLPTLWCLECASNTSFLKLMVECDILWSTGFSSFNLEGPRKYVFSVFLFYSLLFSIHLISLKVWLRYSLALSLGIISVLKTLLFGKLKRKLEVQVMGTWGATRQVGDGDWGEVLAK